jgi:uncharacterized membrane protein YvbJ
MIMGWLIFIIFIVLPAIIIPTSIWYHSSQCKKATDNIYDAVSKNDIERIEKILKSRKAKYIPEYTKVAMRVYVEGMRKVKKLQNAVK